MKKAILKAGTLSKQGILNEYNELIQGNFDELALATSSVSISTKTVDLQISLVTVTIAGSSFTPPITVEPSIFTAILLGDGSGETQEIIQGFVQNGLYYDIVILPLEEPLNNIKISVL